MTTPASYNRNDTNINSSTTTTPIPTKSHRSQANSPLRPILVSARSQQSPLRQQHLPVGAPSLAYSHSRLLPLFDFAPRFPPLPSEASFTRASYPLSLYWRRSRPPAPPLGHSRQLGHGSSLVIGSALSAMLEVSMFHPFDTIARRLINHPGKIPRKHLANVLFAETPAHSPAARLPISSLSTSTNAGVFRGHHNSISIGSGRPGERIARLSMPSALSQSTSIGHTVPTMTFGSASQGSVGSGSSGSLTCPKGISTTGFSQMQCIPSLAVRRPLPKSNIERVSSLFHGISLGMSFKILQRIYKFAGQTAVFERVHSSFGQSFESLFGTRHNAAIASHAFAGALVGAGEVFLVPLDAWKIRKQTEGHPCARQRRSFATTASNAATASATSASATGAATTRQHLSPFAHIRSLYRGSCITLARNIPGSFVFFGGNACARRHLFNAEFDKPLSFHQNCVSSFFGSMVTIVVVSPADVVKTRLQGNGVHMGESALKIFKDTVRQEGVRALFKGLVPKVLIMGPKLTFSFALAQTAIGWVDNLLFDKKEKK